MIENAELVFTRRAQPLDTDLLQLPSPDEPAPGVAHTHTGRPDGEDDKQKKEGREALAFEILIAIDDGSERPGAHAYHAASYQKPSVPPRQQRPEHEPERDGEERDRRPETHAGRALIATARPMLRRHWREFAGKRRDLLGFDVSRDMNKRRGRGNCERDPLSP